MTEIGWASLGVIPSFKGFESRLNSGTAGAMSKAGLAGGTQFGDAASRSAGDRFKRGMATAAKAAAATLAVGIAGAIKFGGDALAEAREAQKVGALTESTIKATGAAAKVTAGDVDRLSSAISRKSGMDDEVIQRGANMLLTFKNIRNEAGKGNKIFNRTTKATADMAAAMAGGSDGEIDLKSASILLGKALNDPVEGLSALTRVGVQFTDQQKAINKALVEGGTLNAMAAMGTKVTATEFAKVQKDNNATTQETIDLIMGPMSQAQTKLFKHYEEGGHALEAQRQILKEVNSQFGGAAAAQATEADKLKVAWANFKEEIGTQLLPVMDDFSRYLRKEGIPAVKDFAGWVRDDMIPAAKDLAGDLKPAVDGIKDVVKWVGKLPAPAKWAGLAAIIGGVGYTKLRGGNSMGGGALGTVGKAVGLAKPIKTFETNPAALGGGVGAGAATATGKVATILSKGVLPVAIVAASAKGLNDFFKWNHKGDTPIEHMTGGKVGEWSRNFFDGLGGEDEKVKTYSKTIGTVNNAWAKVRTTTEGARGEVKLYGSDVKLVPSKWLTTFEAVNLARDKALVKEYGSMLDGLDGRVVTTFLTSINRNNDTGEGGGGVVPGRSPSGPGVQIIHNGNIVANSPREYAQNQQRRARHRNGGGVNIP